ncbi:16S rRNA methyltransferase [Candidatus Woesearchaeota archaeon]|nr:MAG: 16S rRNA methyltransferase [Candidatus Woesearchaeota archaeon]
MSPHYFSREQNSDFEDIKIRFYLKKRKLEIELLGAPGIFSKDRLDLGTELLLNHCLIKDDWKILDMGCGYGPVGITLAILNNSIKVDMVDVNLRALKVARKNVRTKKLQERVNVFESNIYAKIEKKYDSILINPPQTAGKSVCNEMIIKAKDHLKQGGVLQIVARHQKGGKGFEQLMEETFGNVETLAKGSGFRVYVSRLE